MTALVRYDQARSALEKAAIIDEAALIKDQATALKAYARQRRDLAMQRWLTEIQLRARRKIGELSKALKKGHVAGPGRGKQHPKHGKFFSPKTDALTEAGIGRSEANRCEKLAEIPAEEFEIVVANKVKAQKCPTADEAERITRKTAARREKIKEEKDAAKAAIDSDKAWVITDDQTVIPCVAIITDPPYGILDQSWEPDELEIFTRRWLSAWNKSGPDLFLLFWSQRHLFDGRRWFDEELTQYTFQQILIWTYRNNKSPQSKMGFKQTWEPIFFYRKVGCKRKIEPGTAGKWGEDLHDLDTHDAAVPQSNFSNADMKQHPAQKPVSVMRWLVNAVTKPGELIVDPFCGSGTTGIAAVQLGRRFHGIEINPEYRKCAEGRIALYGPNQS